jgi:hypothetical protein
MERLHLRIIESQNGSGGGGSLPDSFPDYLLGYLLLNEGDYLPDNEGDYDPDYLLGYDPDYDPGHDPD